MNDTSEPTLETLDAGQRESIRARLREALTLLGARQHGDARRLGDVVAEALDCVRSLELMQAIEADDALGADKCVVLSVRQAEPATEWLLIPFGEVDVEHPVSGRSFEFTRRHAESARQWFERLGRKLAIDYEHQSFERLNPRPDGLRPAAGWIGGLEVRDDGLWAVDVSWTDRARELLGSGEYRYFSPVIYWTDEDYSDVAALGPVALTNDPAMRGVPALAAARVGAGDELPAGGDTDDADAREAMLLAQRGLDDARSEISRLRRELETQEADAFVERGLRLGKILDSTSMDWRADYLRDAEEAEVRLSRAPVLLPPGRVVRLDERGEIERRSAVELELAGNADMCGRAGIDAEDLAAYERAVLAGRVRRGGFEH